MEYVESEELKTIKAEETLGETPYEARREVIYAKRKHKKDTFSGIKKTSDKRGRSNAKSEIPGKESKLPSYTLLTLIVKEILYNDRRNPNLTWLEPLRNPSKNKAKYCGFHRDYRH